MVEQATKQERWMPIPEFQGYEASDMGSIRRLGKVVRQYLNPSGRMQVMLSAGAGIRKTKHVHSLICAAFYGPRPKHLQCRHLDGNPTNNKLCNLKYGTWHENYNDRLTHGTAPYGNNNGMCRLTMDQVMHIKKVSPVGVKAMRALADEMGLTRYNVYDVMAKRAWGWVEFKSASGASE